MNECLDNEDDDEEAHSRPPSCFFTTPCISGADTPEHTIHPSVVPCPVTLSTCARYQWIFVWTPDWLMQDGLVIR